MAARFYGRQPEIAAAVTGTNGKTSVASFLRQIWEALRPRSRQPRHDRHHVPRRGDRLSHHTTPDPVSLHAHLADLAAHGATHLAFEASSHGLAQYRIDGLQLAAGAFTNISRDHLDYHPDFADYFRAKMRLFTELLQPGAAGGDRRRHARRARKRRRSRGRAGLRLITVGRRGDEAAPASPASATASARGSSFSMTASRNSSAFRSPAISRRRTFSSRSASPGDGRAAPSRPLPPPNS